MATIVLDWMNWYKLSCLIWAVRSFINKTLSVFVELAVCSAVSADSVVGGTQPGSPKTQWDVCFAGSSLPTNRWQYLRAQIRMVWLAPSYDPLLLSCQALEQQTQNRSAIFSSLSVSSSTAHLIWDPIPVQVRWVWLGLGVGCLGCWVLTVLGWDGLVLLLGLGLEYPVPLGKRDQGPLGMVSVNTVWMAGGWGSGGYVPLTHSMLVHPSWFL